MLKFRCVWPGRYETVPDDDVQAVIMLVTGYVAGYPQHRRMWKMVMSRPHSVSAYHPKLRQAIANADRIANWRA